MPEEITLPISGNPAVMKKIISGLAQESDERRMKYYKDQDIYSYMLESENYNWLIEIYFKVLSIEKLNTELTERK